MMQRNEIEKCANDILKRYNIQNSPYSHIKTICDSERIKLKKTQFSPTMDGAFTVIRDEKYIFYNPSMPDGRKNFTKAHELGHYFLNHHLEAGNAIYCYNQNVCENNQQSLPRIETEANYFATFFLMPKEQLITNYIVIADMMNIDLYRPLYVDRQPCNLRDWTIVSNNLTNRFGVSKEALRYRMETLRLLNYNL